MLLGKSVYHVNQGPGALYSKNRVEGYYNDLTEKVTRFGLADATVPKTTIDTGETLYFPIAIFQYGIGAYDLYLQSQDRKYLDKAIACAEWAVENQQEDGSWVTFAFEDPAHPYSSMAQAEAISLLIRINITTKDSKYLSAAANAKNFMLKPLKDGGTTEYVGDDVYLYEYTNQPLILNGWIFSIWGLYDYWKHTGETEVKHIMDRTINALINRLDDYDAGYWSKYDMGERLCSPFYHQLHISQLKVLYDLFGDETFLQTAQKWEAYQKSFWKRKKAFVIKALQKIKE